MRQNELIDKCKKGDSLAQRRIYDLLSPELYVICRRYLKNTMDAEDVLSESFVTIFSRIQSFRGEGSFAGWCKRITINHCLMHIRRKKMEFSSLDNIAETGRQAVAQQNLEAQDILGLMDELPDGYRTVFNLYVIEGYKHREIAELLEISINTSKSQLILAKKKLKHLIDQRNKKERDA